VGKLSTVISTGDIASRLSRLTVIGATALLTALFFTAPRDAHPGDTCQTHRFYLHLSAKHLQGLGDGPVYRWGADNKKAVRGSARWLNPRRVRRFL
jgi:hypothetical protein